MPARKSAKSAKSAKSRNKPAASPPASPPAADAQQRPIADVLGDYARHELGDGYAVRTVGLVVALVREERERRRTPDAQIATCLDVAAREALDAAYKSSAPERAFAARVYERAAQLVRAGAPTTTAG